MNATISRLTSPLARIAAALAAVASIASCGGGVSASPSPIVDSPTLTILPASAVMYSGMPTTFVLSGGTGAYIVSSNNQAILPISGGVTGRSVTLVPNPVTADTPVTLTLRDTGAATPVTALVTVKPGTVTNNVSITPNAQQATSCNPAICSGGDADVQVTISQGGIPLAARGIRFDVVSGDFRFIVTPAGTSPEQVATSQLVATDETGVARARIRVTALAPNQTALLQITEVMSGAYRLVSFAIAQYNGNTPAYFTLPSSITLTGPNTSACSSGVTEVAIFGGSPPYAISNTSTAFTVSPATVLANGGKFTVSFANTAQCVENLPIAVTDSTGRTLIVTVTNNLGTAAPPITLAPATLALSCSFGTTAVTSSLTISGGTPPFSVASDHPRLVVSVTNRTVTVQRLAGDGTTTYPATAGITVTDGTYVATAGVTVPPNCPGGTSTAPFVITPSSATVTGTVDSPGANLLLSGGSGTYSVTFVSDPRITARITGTGSTLNIDTFSDCSVPLTSLSAFVVVSDGNTTQTVPVTGTVCGGTSPTPFAVSPSSATVVGTTNSLGANSLLSGGSGNYTVTFVSDPRITARITGAGSTLNINTTFGCASPTIPLAATVNVSDGTTTLTVSVTATVCP